MSKLKTNNKKTKMEKYWNSILPFYSQWYWMHDWLGCKCKAFYYGPRIDWMKLSNDK